MVSVCYRFLPSLELSRHRRRENSETEQILNIFATKCTRPILRVELRSQAVHQRQGNLIKDSVTWTIEIKHLIK